MESNIPIKIVLRQSFRFACIWILLYGLYLFVIGDRFNPVVVSFFISLISFVVALIYALIPLKKVNRFINLLLEQPKTENIRIADEKYESVFKVGEWEELGGLVKKLEKKLRRRTKALLREKTELTAVIDSLNSPIVAVNSNLEIAFLNSGFAVLYELLAESFKEKTQPLSNAIKDEKVINLFRETIATENFERKLVTIDVEGREKIFSVTMSPLRRGVDHSLYGVVAVFNDETAKIELDEKRMDFVANASHELRTPITAVSSSVKLLRRVEEKDIYDQVVDSLELNAKRLVSLTEDLLDLSKLESYGEDIELMRVDLYKLSYDVLQGFSEKDRERIVIKTGVSFLDCDESKVKQVVTNLLKNGLIYSPEDKRVKISWVQETKKIKLVVEDQGAGIPPKDSSRVFERFYRVDKSRSRKSGGSGIGLSIVKHIMALHGGDVTLAPFVEGRGAKFICTFPEEVTLIQDSSWSDSLAES